jgi:hypothetical protein
LISLSADKIKSYGLSDNPDYVIKQTFSALDLGNLTKVLQGISPEELSSIRDKVTPQTFDNILSAVPQPQPDEIVNKLAAI